MRRRSTIYHAIASIEGDPNEELALIRQGSFLRAGLETDDAQCLQRRLSRHSRLSQRSSLGICNVPAGATSTTQAEVAASADDSSSVNSGNRTVRFLQIVVQMVNVQPYCITLTVICF